MSTEQVNAPTGEEVRELKSRADELLAVFSREGRHAYRPFDCDEVKLVAKLCRHFLASQQPMTAGEFAGLALADLKQVAEDYKRAGTWNGKAFTEYAIARISEVAREHNITILEPKK